MRTGFGAEVISNLQYTGTECVVGRGRQQVERGLEPEPRLVGTDNGINPSTGGTVSNIGLVGVSLENRFVKLVGLLFGELLSCSLGVAKLQGEQRLSGLLGAHYCVLCG